MMSVGWPKTDRPWLHRLLSPAALGLAAISAASMAAPFALAAPGADKGHHCNHLPDRHLARDSRPAAYPGAARGDVTDYPLGVGDTVRVRVYGREDLSGEFQIRTDGTIAVPLLGALSIAGQTRAEAKAALTEAMVHSSVQSTDISLEVAEWRSLYVVGEVEEPGAFPFQPGMTVTHAIAVAGGFYRPEAFTNLLVDSSRAQKDLRDAKLDLMHALARRARLEAEVEGRKSVEVPDEFGQFVDEAASERLMAAENRILERRRQSRHQQKASLRKQIGHATGERAAYQQQLTKVEHQIELTHQELSRIRNLAKRGLTPKTRVLQLERQVAELESEAREIVADVSRSQRVLVITEREHARLDIDRLLQIERELQEADADILRAKQEKRAAEALLRQLTNLSLERRKARSERVANYRVIRVIGHDKVTFNAPETALLCPGDVIHVAPDDRPTSGSEAQQQQSIRTGFDHR